MPRPQRPARVRRRAAARLEIVGGALAIILVAYVGWALVRGVTTTPPGQGRGQPTVASSLTPPAPPLTTTQPKPIVLVVRRTAELSAPLQDGAAARLGSTRLLLAGGLTASAT